MPTLRGARVYASPGTFTLRDMSRNPLTAEEPVKPPALIAAAFA